MQDWAKGLLSALAAAVVGAVGGAIKHLYSRQKAQAARQDAVEDGLRGLLHDRLYQTCTACQRKGFADVHDRENIEALYKPYHALGGNGTGTDLYNKARALPIEPPETAA